MKPPRIHGVPVHPVLVHFPVAGWTAATLLTLLALAEGNATLALIARWCNIAGLVTGIAAMAAGFLELAGLPEAPEIRGAVARHLLLAGSAWTVYLVMLFLQLKGFSTAAGLAGATGFALLVFAGHAGARLVYHHGLPKRNSPA
ncbi:MAG TPA: DUF2231 domain-containing protein [Gammaproteobacteria bacterium]